MKKNNLFKAIGIVILAFVLITWIVPIIYGIAGIKESVSYQVGLASILSVITETFSGFGTVILFVLLVGGFYGVLKCTGAYDKMMNSLLACSSGKEKKSLIILIINLAIISSVSGLELGLLIVFPFLLGYVTKMGYSKLVALTSTVGATIIGMYGSTFAGTVYGLNNQIFQTTVYSQFLFKIIFLVVGLAALLFFVLRMVKKEKVKASKKAVSKKESACCPCVMNYAVVFAFGYALAGLIGSIITGGLVKIIVLAVLFVLFTILAILMLRKKFEKSGSTIICSIVFLLLGALFALSTLGVTPLFMSFAVINQIFIESVILLLFVFFLYVISVKGKVLCDSVTIYGKILLYAMLIFAFGYTLAGLVGAIITGGLIKILVLATLFVIFTTLCVLMFMNNKASTKSKAASKGRKLVKKNVGIFDYKKSFIVFGILFLLVGALFGLSTLGITPLFMKYAVTNQIVIESVILIILALVLLIYVCKKAQIKEFGAVPAFIICGVLFLIVFLGTTVWSDIFGIDWFGTAHSSWTGFKVAGFDVLHKIIGVTTSDTGAIDVIDAMGSWSDPNRFKVYSILLIFAMIALSMVYRKNAKDSFEGFADGLKSFVVPAVLVILIYSVFVFTYYSPVISTVTAHMLGKSFNILLTGLYVIINAIVSVDYYYFAAIIGSNVAQQYTDPAKLSIISVMFANLYSLVMLVAPTSVLLMVMLSLSETKYTDWFKFIWKLALALLLISFIVFIIMLAV